VNTELAEAIKRFDNAAEPDVTYIGVQWPAFDHFLQSFSRLEHATEGLAALGILRDELEIYRRARRVLRTTPLSPEHHSTGLASLDSILRQQTLGGELQDALEAVREAARVLVTEPHPAAERLRSVLNGGDRVRFDGLGQIRAVTVNDLSGEVATLLASLAPSGVSADAMGRSQSRFMPSCDLTILLGSPENLVAWQVEPADRPRHISWVFNAPMSPRILVISWPGNAEFNVSRYEPTPTSDHFDPRVEGTRKFLSGTPANPEPTITDRPRVAVPENDNYFDAVDVQLPDGLWISYGLDAGPRAVRIDEDTEFGIEIEERVAPKRLRRGNTLVIVKSGAARDLRTRLCHQWVAEHRAPLTGQKAMETVDTYRKALRAKYANSGFVATLVSKGLDEGYVRNQLARAWDPSAMAPQRYENFERFCTTLGLQLGPDQWKHILALRGGYIAAGVAINGMLKDAIRSDYSWQDTVEQQQIATITVGELGEVTLAPVLAVAHEPIRRPIMQLGELLS
jgi:hypothetical protein